MKTVIPVLGSSTNILTTPEAIIEYLVSFSLVTPKNALEGKSLVSDIVSFDDILSTYGHDRVHDAADKYARDLQALIDEHLGESKYDVMVEPITADDGLTTTIRVSVADVNTKMHMLRMETMIERFGGSER